jgi:organic radical activating enzyme
MYQVKEIFYTLQGEGMNAGRPAVFCRFAGRNLWSGQEKDRAGAVCKFCDTDFVAALARVEVRRESCRHGCVYAGN